MSSSPAVTRTDEYTVIDFEQHSQHSLQNNRISKTTQIASDLSLILISFVRTVTDSRLSLWTHRIVGRMTLGDIGHALIHSSFVPTSNRGDCDSDFPVVLSFALLSPCSRVPDRVPVPRGPYSAVDHRTSTYSQLSVRVPRATGTRSARVP